MALKSLGLQKIYLDFKNRDIMTYYSNNADIKTRGLEIHVLNNGVAFDCTGATLSLYVRTENHDVYESISTTAGGATGVYEVLYPEGIAGGTAKGEIILKNSTETIASFQFSVKVINSLTSDGILADAPGAGILFSVIKNENDRMAAEAARVIEFNNMIAKGYIVPKAPVATYADLATTYSSPVSGWTSKVMSDGKLYRYDGSVWNWIDTITASSYDALLTTFTAQLAQNANYRYISPTIPAQDGSVTGEFNAETITAADIYAAFDALMAQHPNYIHKSYLGNDQSNTLPIYMYDFRPETAIAQDAYNNNVVSLYSDPIYKVIVGAGIHGNGTGGDNNDHIICTYYLFKDLCERSHKDHVLSALRNNVRFMVIPVQNPWGINNKSRYNSNGVDINRNFDYYWNENSETTKGSAPFSEKESQYIRDILLANTDAIAYIDVHARGGTTFSQTNPVLLTSLPYNSIIMKTAQNVMGWMKDVYSNVAGIANRANMFQHVPVAFVYGLNVLGIDGCNPECAFMAFDGDTKHSSLVETINVTKMGNEIWQLYQQFLSTPKKAAYGTTQNILIGNALLKIVNGIIVSVGSNAVSSLINGSFESDLTGWTVPTDHLARVTASTSKKYIGAKAMQINVSAQGGYANQSVAMTDGNKIYVAESALIESGSLTSDIFGSISDYAGNSILNIVGASTVGSWQFFSAIVTAANGGIRLTLGRASNQTAVYYFDGVLVIDLTALYGSGNEPSKAQCDTLYQAWIKNI